MNKLILISFIFIIIAFSPKAYDPSSFGTWTPTITSTTNVSSNTPHSGNYIRIGNKVIFSSEIDITPTSGSTNTSFNASLPIPSNFTTLYDASGTNSGHIGTVLSDATNDVLTVTFTSEVSGAQTITINGTYWIK